MKKFEGEPVIHLESLIASSFLGVDFLPAKQIQILPHYIELNDNFIQLGWPSANFHYYDVGSIFDRPQYKDKDSNMLYKTEYFLMNHQVDHVRSAYDIVTLLGDIGGVIEIVMVVSALILSPYSEFIYLTKALKKLYLARTKKKNLFMVSRKSF